MVVAISGLLANARSVTEASSAFFPNGSALGISKSKHSVSGMSAASRSGIAPDASEILA